MTILAVYSIFDRKAIMYNTPFFQPNVAVARRTFADLLVDNKTIISKHPDDYALYELGHFDTNTALSVMYKMPLLIDLVSEDYRCPDNEDVNNLNDDKFGDVINKVNDDNNVDVNPPNVDMFKEQAI